ncbi:hypothetical protein ES702_02144 [subsurface metagenome]
MPYKRGKTFKITLDEDAKLELERLSKSSKKTQTIIASHAIMQVAPMRMLEPDWEDRIKELENVRTKADDQHERYTRLEGSCPALTFADKFYVCVWGQDGKPPAKKKLAKDLDEALEICAACNKTLNIKLENESYQVKVQELEIKLKKQSTKKFKIPQCKQGARLDSDGLAFEGCPRSIGKPVSIEGYCKKINDGRGCDWFTLRLVGVGAET